MELQQVTYDICRNYLQDRRETLPKEIFDRLHGLVRGRAYKDLATCFTDSMHDVTCVEAARTLHQVEAFFKKNASFTDRLQARLAALLSFETGEELCESTNKALDEIYFNPDKHPVAVKQIESCQRYIQMVLGDFSDFLEELPKLVSVTAGATATNSRRRSIPFLKINKRIVCTPGAFPYLDSLSDHFGYGSLQGRLISENRISFVPKSWKTERTIACEAEGNMFLQLAVDKYVKRRLRNFGIDLSDQGLNQELAKEGSINGDLATIDLSMASDTLAYNTVALLFPGDWFQFLRSIRSQYFSMYPDKRQAYAKFSSMGNGATFVLETLVFAACCRALRPSTFTVYGDDIVIDSVLADGLIELLATLGFVPNTDKTYSSGPFRESCGKSWWKGFDITPRYIRGVDRRKATWCHLINTMVSISKPCGLLQKYLSSIVKDKQLPLVPWNEDTMSGVWITPHDAYSLNLIRIHTRGKRAWKPMYRGYQSQSRLLRCSDMRALFLWHLAKQELAAAWWQSPIWRLSSGRRLSLTLSYRKPYEATRYSASRHRYVRKWVHWRPVEAGVPDNLNWFSDLLVPVGSRGDARASSQATRSE